MMLLGGNTPNTMSFKKFGFGRALPTWTVGNP